MHAPLVIGSVVSVIVLIAGMITTFALQTSEHRAVSPQQVDSSELTRSACHMPLERIENAI